MPAVSAQVSSRQDSYITEFQVPQPHLGPLAIVHHAGKIWFTLDGSNAIGVFNPSDESFEIYGLPWKPSVQVRQYGMEGIAVDKDGIIWFTHSSTSRVGKFNPTSQTFSGVQIRQNASVFRVLADNDGNIWYSDIQNNKIGFISPDGTVTEFDLPTAKSGPAGLFFDSSGRLWFTETFAKKVGMFDPQTKSITEFPAPRNFVNSLVGIVVDGDDIVWVADHGGSAIASIDPKTNTWQKFLTSRPPPDIYPISLPNDIAIDRQGNLWIAEHAGNKIAKFDKKTGLLTEYIIPSVPAITLWLTLDDEGNVWFAEAQAGKIGKLDVKKPVSFSLVLSNDVISVSAGKPTSFSAVVEFSGSAPPISILSYGFPSSINITANPKQIPSQSSGSQRSELQINLGHGVDEGKYGFAISASDGRVLQTRTLTVQVQVERQNQDTMIFTSIGLVIATAIAIIVFIVMFRRLWKG